MVCILGDFLDFHVLQQSWPVFTQTKWEGTLSTILMEKLLKIKLFIHMGGPLKYPFNVIKDKRKFLTFCQKCALPIFTFCML